MDMQDSSLKLKIDEHEFEHQLTLHAGQQRSVPINQLASTAQQAYKHRYAAVEFTPLRLESNGLGRVRIRWNVPFHLSDEDEDALQFELHEEATEKWLYKEGIYPWPCGLYLFEVQIDEENLTGYGMFEVLPKNMSSEQIRSMHNIVNEYLEHLSIDFFRYSMGPATLMESSTDWAYYQRYKNYAHEVEALLWSIDRERLSYTAKHYSLENIPRKITNKSVRMSVRNQKDAASTGQFYNSRTVIEEDIPENQTVKRGIQEIHTRLIRLQSEIKAILDRLKQETDELMINIQHLTANLEAQHRAPTITYGSIKLTERELNRKVREQRKKEEELRQYEQMRYELDASAAPLKHFLNQPFWAALSDLRGPEKAGRRHPYQRFYQILTDLRAMERLDSNKSCQLTPVNRPTSVLYEYFVYFMFIKFFQDREFQIKENELIEKLQASFGEEGIQDRSSITWEYENYRLKLVFNEELYINEEQAMQFGEGIFCTADRRKPDIRLDLYETDGEQLRLISLIPVEVKYSPFYNLYSSQGRTRAMEQMDSYLTIRYVYSSNGKRKYNRHPVDQVLCVYPYTDGVKTEEERANGSFIQLNPNDDHTIHGYDELKKRLDAWLQENGVFE